MLTTDRLLDIADLLYCGDTETVKIDAPTGDNLPVEWQEKIGSYTLSPSWVVHLENVDLYGAALVGVSGHDVILDTSYFGRFDLWERNLNQWRHAVQCFGNKSEKIAHGVSMGNVWSANYFHWIVDTLPKLQLIAKAKVRPVLLFGYEPPPFVQAYLDSMDFDYRISRTFHFRVKHLYIPSTRRTNGIPYPSAVEYLQRLAQPMDKGWKLYITRRRAVSRRVVNEDDFLDKLRDDGYSILELEDLGISAQRNYFAGASLVVAPHGAGLANIAFGSPEVVELVSPLYTNPCCWLLGSVAGCDYRFVVGEHAGDVENIRVDYPDIIKLI